MASWTGGSAVVRRVSVVRWSLTLAFAASGTADAAEPKAVSFTTTADRVTVAVGDAAIATYVYRDPQIPRPYLAHLRAMGGEQVTRNHPPVPDRDATDHATYHPGLWLAFGDLGGADFWRNRARVEHEAFIEKPTGGSGQGRFVVRNRYVAPNDGRTVCTEVCRYVFHVRPYGVLMVWDSVFRADRAFHFGDQEEMGLGVRVATPLTVKRGGKITNSEGAINEALVWGRAADWCDYSGAIGNRRVGVTLMPDPQNFRRSWFHARDYGLLVANPFGRRAFRHGSESRVVVEPGQPFRLRFGVLVHESPADHPLDSAAAYRDYLRLSRALD